MTRPDPPIFVFQMAKVASISWLQSIEAAAGTGAAAHFHFASAAGCAMAQGVCDAEGEEQTVAHRIMFRRIGLPPPQVSEHLIAGRWHGGAVRILCGIRDPMSRAVSVLQNGADYYGYTRLPLTLREGGTVENLLTVYRRAWDDALAGIVAPDTFRRFLAWSIGHYRHWFEEELAGVFDLDIGRSSFDRSNWSLRHEAGDRSVLVYRVEDLAHADRRARLLDAASDFLGLRLTDLPTANSAEGRRSRDLYRQFQDRAGLPQTQIERIYDWPVLKQFYDADELAGFMKRWTVESLR